MDRLWMKLRWKYFLFFIGFLFAYILLYTLRDCKVNILNQSLNETVKALVDSSVHRAKQNQISLVLDIHDIYRVDISCEYITKHLGGRISEEYKNHKKCSLSSLKNDLNELLQNTLVTKESRFKPVNEIDEKNIFEKTSQEQISKKYIQNSNEIKEGGFYEPLLKPNSICQVNDLDFVVFIIPFMDRLENLNVIITNLHNYLINNAKFQFSYLILVAEQSSNGRKKFNKGQLFNRAVKYVQDTYRSVDCIVLHDVDIIPNVKDGSIDYRCRQMPLHLTNQVLVLKSNWNRVYNQFLTGGILSLRPQHFINSNGFSNIFSGWGGEDDDWTLRMFNKKLCIIRPDNPAAPDAPFLMLKHDQAHENRDRYSLLSGSLERQFIDGYNQIEQFTSVLSTTKHMLFTHLLIEVEKNV